MRRMWISSSMMSTETFLLGRLFIDMFGEEPRRISERQTYGKNRSAAKTVFYFNDAALRFDKTFHQRETQTRPARWRGWPSIKFFKDSIQGIGRDAGPMVGHFKDERFAVGAGPNVHHCARRGVKRGVGKQICERLLHQD